MKKYLFTALVFVVIVACSTTNNSVTNNSEKTTVAQKTVSKGDTIRIANDSLEYEVIIIDAGFNTYLNSRARQRNYYGLSFLEIRNSLWVSEWNRRVLDPFRYNPNLYEMRIDYSPQIRYGYEVNYLIYNYFLYFQETYKQKL